MADIAGVFDCIIQRFSARGLGDGIGESRRHGQYIEHSRCILAETLSAELTVAGRRKKRRQRNWRRPC
jgi:hypothetical protein